MIYHMASLTNYAFNDLKFLYLLHIALSPLKRRQFLTRMFELIRSIAKHNRWSHHNSPRWSPRTRNIYLACQYWFRKWYLASSLFHGKIKYWAYFDIRQYTASSYYNIQSFLNNVTETSPEIFGVATPHKSWFLWSKGLIKPHNLLRENNILPLYVLLAVQEYTQSRGLGNSQHIFNIDDLLHGYVRWYVQLLQDDKKFAW